jgi:hypothetical protein
MGVKKELAKKVKDAIKKKKELYFLHNTTSGRIDRFEKIGGMPMPSIAVTKEGIPFEGFGDITLVGKPESFDPKIDKRNQAFNADAYTVTAPQMLRVAKKNAGKRFAEIYEPKYKEKQKYVDEVRSNIWDLESSKNADVYKYNQVADWLERQSESNFLDSKGVKYKLEKNSGRPMPEDVSKKIAKFKKSGEYQDYVNGIMDDLFEKDEFFISNPDRDRYATKPKLVPYNAQNVTDYMAKSAGRAKEGGFSQHSTGAIRASTAKEFKSLDEMRGNQGKLVTPEEMEEFKQTSSMMLDDLEEAFKKYYDYDSNSSGYYREFRDFVKRSEEVGARRAGKEIGFSNVDESLLKELDDYKDMLRGGATEYFESKPKRVVEISEFGGAIVPKNAPKNTIERLKASGLKVVFYDPAKEGSRVEARKKFQNMAFSAGAGLAVGGLGLGASQESEASMIGQSAKTFNKAALEYAQMLEKQGAPAEAIRKMTGYQFNAPMHRGVDGKWRQEISDEDFSINELPVIAKEYMMDSTHSEYPLKLSDVVNSKTLSEYPDLQGIPLRLTNKIDSGYYKPKTSESQGGKEVMGLGMKHNKQGENISQKSTALHEIQHAIQEREGFAKGGMPEDMAAILDELEFNKVAELHDEKLNRFNYLKNKYSVVNEKEIPGEIIEEVNTLKNEITKLQARGNKLANNPFRGQYTNEELFDAYKRLAGEEEARQTQKRLDLTMKERIDRNPNLDFDNPPERQIVIGAKGQASPAMLATVAGVTGAAAALTPKQKAERARIARMSRKEKLALGLGAVGRGIAEIPSDVAKYAHDIANAGLGLWSTADLLGGATYLPLAATGNQDVYERSIQPYIEQTNESQSGGMQKVEQVIGDVVGKGLEATAPAWWPAVETVKPMMDWFYYPNQDEYMN